MRTEAQLISDALVAQLDLSPSGGPPISDETLVGIDLNTYNPYSELAAGGDGAEGEALALLMRQYQTQVAATQLAAILTVVWAWTEYRRAGGGVPTEAEYSAMMVDAGDAVFRELSKAILERGFGQLRQSLLGLMGTAAAEVVQGGDIVQGLNDLGMEVQQAAINAIHDSYDLIEETKTDAEASAAALPAGWARFVVDDLNRARGAHCAEKLVWDDELAAAAQAYAEACPAASGDTSNESNEGHFGEAVSVGGSGDHQEAITAWFDTAGLYVGAYEPESDAFVQANWAGYGKVGCGFVLGSSTPAPQQCAKFTMVCRFAPADCDVGAAVDGTAKCRGAYDDPVALNASLTSRVGANCAYPFPARVQLYRNQGAKRAWVGAGFVREQLERLVANQVNPKAFAAATDMAILKDMAAKKVLEIANRPFPPNPPPPPPPPGLPTMENAFRQEGDAEWNTAPIWAPILAVFLFVTLCVGVPCFLYRRSGGHVTEFVRVHTSHSNPNTVNRYMPAETRLAKKEKLERDRAALGRAIDAQPFALLGWAKMPFLDVEAWRVDGPVGGTSSTGGGPLVSPGDVQPTLPDSPDGRGGLTAPLCANQGGSAREVGAQWLNREAGTPASKSNVGSQKRLADAARAASAENVAACAAAADAPSALAALAPLSPPGADLPPMPDDGEAPTPREGGGDTDTSGPGQAPPSEVEETEEETLRRIEWIKYYVRIGAPEQAYELGWDGLPFQMD